MKTSRIHFRRLTVAFTLIELLVVIAIIAILAAMLLPAVNVAKRKAAEASARADMQNIGLAIARYEADYNGRFPAPGISAGTEDVTFGYSTNAVANLQVRSITTNSGVIAVLMDVEKFANGVDTANKGHVLNPRRIANLNAKAAIDTSSGGVGPDGEYRDPWGNPYVISMDTSLDDRCSDYLYSRTSVSQQSGQTGYYGLYNPTNVQNRFEHNGKFLIWSPGADRKANPTQKANFGDNRDNILGWKE